MTNADTARDIAAEQEVIDRALARLDAMRASARALYEPVLDQGAGGTPQAKTERDILVRTGLARLVELDVGDAPLCFGRIDRTGGDVLPLGRVAISDADHEPLIVDWRAPAAEPFYRATPRHPMGLSLRRHLEMDGCRVVGLQDEHFGDGSGAAGASGTAGAGDEGDGEVLAPNTAGRVALLSAMARPRTGQMRDIVATIQREQDEAVRAPLPGLLVVQGGPGTGKTAVALHRAAYLLYTHRFPLERQGMLVVGPNPVFMRYIEHVLPSLGENGVTMATIPGLVPRIRPRSTDADDVARLKGDARMSVVVANAVRDRERVLGKNVRVPFGAAVLTLTRQDSARIVSSARRRRGPHNARRRYVEERVATLLADRYRASSSVRFRLGAGGGRTRGAPEPGPAAAGRAYAAGVSGSDIDAGELAGAVDVDIEDNEIEEAILRVPAAVGALDHMWPLLAPEELLNDLFGVPVLLESATRGVLKPGESTLLQRTRCSGAQPIPWTIADIPLVDEAYALLGRRRRSASSAHVRQYGHIVVDEVQDLSPMGLRMLARRSLSGSMTAVGDLAQATGTWAPSRWEDIAHHLNGGRPLRLLELHINYRTPGKVMDMANRVLAASAPHLVPPRAGREGADAPRIVDAGGPGPALAACVAEVTATEAAMQPAGTVGVIVPAELVPAIARALASVGIEPADPEVHGLGGPVTVVPVATAKGLEFDAVVVVEPAQIAAQSLDGLRALYVAMTRTTGRLALVHGTALPDVLR